MKTMLNNQNQKASLALLKKLQAVEAVAADLAARRDKASSEAEKVKERLAQTATEYAAALTSDDQALIGKIKKERVELKEALEGLELLAQADIASIIRAKLEASDLDDLTSQAEKEFKEFCKTLDEEAELVKKTYREDLQRIESLGVEHARCKALRLREAMRYTGKL